MASSDGQEHVSISDIEISVVIPNWNGAAYLPDCLSSLAKQTFRKFEIIIIDNGSRDNSVDFVKTHYPWVTLLELPENIGFAAACNLGIKAAKGQYIAVLNNDTEVMPQWIGSLLHAAEQDKLVGMVASKILLNLEPPIIDSVGMLIYPDGIGRQRGRLEVDTGQFDRVEEILFPSACAALYKKEMLQEIGLFDEDFFAYCEDTDIGLRGRFAGWKAVFSPKAIVYHKYSLTGGKYSAFKAMHVERNRIWVALKNFPVTWILRLPYYSLKRYIVQLYGILASRGSTARFKETHSTTDIILTMMKAYAASLSGVQPILKKRKKRMRKISSREFSSILAKYRISVRELILRD